MWFFKKKTLSVPDVPLFRKVEISKTVKLYDVIVALKRKDVSYKFTFNSFDEALKVKESMAAELSKGIKSFSYEHKGKNVIWSYWESPYRIVMPYTALEHITFAVDDISVIRLVDYDANVRGEKIVVNMTEKEFDDKVSEWHNSPDIKISSMTLYQYLGFTESEYSDIAEHFIPVQWKEASK